MLDEAYEKNFAFEDRHWWFLVRNRIVLEMIRKYSKTENPRILDYGCGTGKMLEEMQSLGDVTGCDSSEKALATCCKRGDFKLVKIDETPANLGSFDLITMLDVLEHIDDDQAALSNLARRLDTGGKIVLTVPAFQCLWSGEDYVSDHKRRYLKKQLADVVRSCGLKILKISYFNFVLLPPIFLYIKLKTMTDPESMKHSNLQESSGFTNNILRFLFGLEIPMLHYCNLPVGMSLICVAEKI